MGEMTREERAAMTDQELLAHEREHHGDPYMTLAKAKEMQRVALQFWHLGTAKKKADREVQEEARRRLNEKLFPPTPLVNRPPIAASTSASSTSSTNPVHQKQRLINRSGGTVEGYLDQMATRPEERVRDWQTSPVLRTSAGNGGCV
jgi:hypothetical protein